MESYEQIIKISNGSAKLNFEAFEVYCYSLWNYSRKLFIMQETSHTNLTNEFVKAFEENGLAKVYNSS